MAFALFNILTGVFVEKAVASCQPDQDELVFKQRMQAMQESEELRALCSKMDTDASGTISAAEFTQSMHNLQMLSYMASEGLEVNDVDMFFKCVAKVGPKDAVDIDTSVQGCMSMRGSASGIDLQRLMFDSKTLLTRTQSFESHSLKKLDSLAGECAALKDMLWQLHTEKDIHVDL